MKYNLAEVADLFGVSQSTITRWVQQDSLPVHEINAQYRFDRSELLEWAAYRKQPFSVDFFRDINGDQITQISLAEAIEEAGPVLKLAGGDKETIYRALIDAISLPSNLSAGELLELLLSREKAGGTAVGEGIAIPHPRYPIVVSGRPAMVKVVYLEQPLDFSAPDRKMVDTLFFMLAPTVHIHLQLLSRIASMLSVEPVRKQLARRADQAELVQEIQAAEEAFVEC